LPKAVSHFWWLPTTLSAVLSTLGILALAKHAFVTWSLSAPFELMLAAYNAAMQLVFGWAHPYLQAALTWLGSFIGWRPMLYPHWRDVFVVIGLIGVSTGRDRWRGGDFRPTAFAAPIGVLLGAAITALAAGLLPLQTPELTTQLLIAASFGLAVLITFSLDKAVRREFDGPIRSVINLTLVTAAASGMAALATLLLSLLFGSAVGLGLAGIACVVVAIALFAVVVSTIFPDLKGPLQIGLSILGGFIGAAFVCAVDAGLKLLGA
jgi:hypothetical protein